MRKTKPEKNSWVPTSGQAGTQHAAPVHAANAAIILLRKAAGFLLACALCASQAHGQAAPNSQGAHGTKQKIANPLNDLLDEARRDIDKQDFQAAIAPLQKFLAEKDDFAYAHFQLGYAYTGLQKSKEARGEYERAMLLDPKMPEAALNLGILLLNEEPSAAVGPLQRAVELLPTQSRPRTLLGLAYEKSGDLKNAASVYEGALALDPKDIETSLHLARLYLRQNRAAEAEAKFRAVLSGEPASQPALVGLAQSLEMEKSPEAADAYRDYLKAQIGRASCRERVYVLV